MAIESPLFQSAMELYSHSFSHFNAREEIDRKLVILHLANAVELILKDLVLESGESIYKGPKETITIHGAIKTLDEQSKPVPYLNKIELLIDERNALQHRFGSPNELTTIFYMNIAQDFFKKILEEHYGLDYQETIEQFVEANELATFEMQKLSGDEELVRLRKLAAIHPLGALLAVTTYTESLITAFLKETGFGGDRYLRSPMGVSFKLLERYGLETPEDLSARLADVRRLRNAAAHGRADPSREDVIEGISAVQDYEKFLSSVDREKFALKAQALKDAEERERKLNREANDELSLLQAFERRIQRDLLEKRPSIRSEGSDTLKADDESGGKADEAS